MNAHLSNPATISTIVDDLNANQQRRLEPAQKLVVAVAVLLVSPVLALALAPIVLVMAPISLVVLPFVASAFLGGAKDAPRCEKPAIRRSQLALVPAV